MTNLKKLASFFKLRVIRDVAPLSTFFHKKHVENSEENTYTDIEVYRVKNTMISPHLRNVSNSH